MSEAVAFFDGFLNQVKSGIHVAKTARIERFYADEMKADIQPLQGLPMLFGVPVLLNTGPYEQGDTVLAIYIDYALDGSSDESHRLDDAVIIGKFKP